MSPAAATLGGSGSKALELRARNAESVARGESILLRWVSTLRMCAGAVNGTVVFVTNADCQRWTMQRRI
ncbi:hypothetical protein C8T65DRAFT_640176, partial [Cerioporus squamosus]